MIILKHTDAYHGVLADVRNARLDQLGEYSDLATFIIVEPGDRPEDIQPDPTINLVDGLAFGHPDYVPSWESCERHDDAWELCFILSDDGFGHIILIPDREGIDPRLLALCREHA
ncbi:hypothetical protein [Sphingobium estronivorans]|uniref:hypothetical protein n=1 Tax=Sphingobium estronivorans TaxID=1577690 RepID=UPI00123BAF7E|nr:hypothetical protein [Sphingobium estronivorans]